MNKIQTIWQESTRTSFPGIDAVSGKIFTSISALQLQNFIDLYTTEVLNLVEDVLIEQFPPQADWDDGKYSVALSVLDEVESAVRTLKK